MFFFSFSGSAIELHYWFKDGTHNMDAFVQNKCENELLNIIKTIAAQYGEEITIETEAIGTGGLRRWFAVVTKTEKRKPVITTALITAVFTSVLINPIGTSVSKITENVIEKAFQDEEDKTLDKEKKKAEIESIKADTELKKQQLQQNNLIIKRRSNFYDILSNYPKLSRISFMIQDDKKRNLLPEQFVDKNEFNKYILETDELEPLQINDALIEIVSPVLKKGNYKWRGIFNGSIIPFSMKSIEFKSLVQNGSVEFKNGTTIKCLLEIKRKISSEGVEEYSDYRIIRVDEYFLNDKPIETKEGRKFRKAKEAAKNQFKLFDDPPNN